MNPTVVFVTGRDPQHTQACGHTSYVRTHARAANRAGYDVHLICLAPAARTEQTDYGTVHALATAVPVVRQNLIPRHSPVLSQAIASLVMTLGQREVVLHGFGVWGHAVARADRLLAARGLRCAKLLGSYTTYLDESQSQWRGLSAADGPRAYARFALEQAWIRTVVLRYERQGYCEADRVLVNYRSVDRLIAARFGDGVRRQIIPYTIEEEFLDGARAPAGDKPAARYDKVPRAPVILCVARHDPRKGVDVLLRALRRLREAGIGFSAQLVGGGVLLDAHRRLAASLQLSDCVEILGTVPSVDRYLAGADIFVLPSREEQSGSLALIEAMRAGIACVASSCDGIHEDLRHGEDGWLARPGDAASLAGGIGALIADPRLRSALARAGRRAFATKFSAAGFTGALDRVYRDVLSGRGAAA